jgi:hypothetical protein
VLVNMVVASVERLLQRRLLAVEVVDVSKPAMMLLNNGIGLALTAVVALFVPGEYGRLWRVFSENKEARPACLGSNLRREQRSVLSADELLDSSAPDLPLTSSLTPHPPTEQHRALYVAASAVVSVGISSAGLWFQSHVTATTFMVAGGACTAAGGHKALWAWPLLGTCPVGPRLCGSAVAGRHAASVALAAIQRAPPPW